VNGELFVDTGAWYALQVPDDAHHEAAAQSLTAIVARGLRLCTSNLVVGETYTLLIATHGHAAAWRFVDQVTRSPRVERVSLDSSIESEAWDILRRFADQPFSFVDGTSFAIMRKRRLRLALAFDRHFATAGFVRIPEDAPVP
jgi:predicted nucleic acid-binding protein